MILSYLIYFGNPSYAPYHIEGLSLFLYYTKKIPDLFQIESTYPSLQNVTDTLFYHIPGWVIPSFLSDDLHPVSETFYYLSSKALIY